MVSVIRRLVLSCLVALSLVALPLQASAATATLSVTPKKALDGSSITVHAAHLHPNRFFTFMLVGPKAKQDRRLLGSAETDSHGTISTAIKMPVILHCGKSSIYVLDTKHILARAKVTITGCTLKGKPGSPPPAPGKS